jgi:hypothetical protein
MPKQQRKSSRASDLALAVTGLLLGLLAACGYGAWRAVSKEAASAGQRWSAFGEALVFPGLLVIAAIASMVWLGWKANID